MGSVFRCQKNIHRRCLLSHVVHVPSVLVINFCLFALTKHAGCPHLSLFERTSSKKSPSTNPHTSSKSPSICLRLYIARDSSDPVRTQIPFSGVFPNPVFLSACLWNCGIRSSLHGHYLATGNIWSDLAAAVYIQYLVNSSSRDHMAHIYNRGGFQIIEFGLIYIIQSRIGLY